MKLRYTRSMESPIYLYILLLSTYLSSVFTSTCRLLYTPHISDRFSVAITASYPPYSLARRPLSVVHQGLDVLPSSRPICLSTSEHSCSYCSLVHHSLFSSSWIIPSFLFLRVILFLFLSFLVSSHLISSHLISSHLISSLTPFPLPLFACARFIILISCHRHAIN
ncbi:hypothetical protein GGI35DRAFT_193737 [Trichoderma velutinum]